MFSANKLLNESMCHTFTEDGLVSFFNLGANFQQRQPLCRNYFPFVSVTVPTIVDMSNITLLQDVDQYYGGLDIILRRTFHNLTEFADTLRQFVATSANHIYIYQFSSSPTYWRSHLASPYVTSTFSQRMVLPWQDTSSAKLGECDAGVSASQFHPTLGSVIV